MKWVLDLQSWNPDCYPLGSMYQPQTHSTALDPYLALGVDPTADDGTIRRAFRKLAFELHPDRNRSEEARERFVQVRKAYEQLTDPSFRREKEAEVIVEQMTRAAEAATRTRTHQPQQDTYSRILVQSAIPKWGIFRLNEQLAQKRMITGVLVSALLFVAAGVVHPLIAIGGGISLILAIAIWLSRGRPSELLVYGHGFVDSRWDAAGRIGWADIKWLDTDPTSETLDLLLSADVASYLISLPNAPKGILVSQKDKLYYRLHLGARYKHVVGLIADRTGLIIPSDHSSDM